MFKDLAQKLLDARKNKSLLETEVIGQQFEIKMNGKAISIDEKNFQATFVMSTENVDRHGDIIDQDSWILDYFLQSPMFFLQHRSNEFPLGKWLKIWREADPDNLGKVRLVGTAEFAVELGEDVKRAWNHVVRGDMGAVSVGFIPHRIDYDEKKDAFVLYDCELMECSLVGIGSNRQALIKDGKDVEDKKDATIKDVKETLIDSQKVLDELNKQEATRLANNELKAQRLLHKAIRQLKL